jgi:homoserine O-succinyltransferase/O-acetyltransferase
MSLTFRTRDLPPSEVAAIAERTSTAADNLVRVALVNNMPDAALEDTEAQFVELLGAAACDVPVELTLFSIPTVPRGERAQQRLDRFYFGLGELLSSRLDGVIITGTEPRCADLRQEPYWGELTTVMDWAEECSHSAILSCLAAHAGVLHSDGILRQRLEDKRFGVFAENKFTAHALTESVESPVCFPHSRWNDLPADGLIAHGYSILTRGNKVGAGLFVKQKKESLFVHFQGHPEYREPTLLKEFRRDVKRFLLKERETYPSLPYGYFDSHTESLLNVFRDEAVSNRKEEVISKFPLNSAAIAVEKNWHDSSVAIYNRWLHYMISRRSERNQARISVQAATR